MNDTTPTTATTDGIAIDAANVLHNAGNVVADARKEAERDARHGLNHLEDEFLAECRKMATYSETELKRLLAWLASKV